jgi:hypothetical protein
MIGMRKRKMSKKGNPRRKKRRRGKRRKSRIRRRLNKIEISTKKSRKRVTS